MTYPFTGVIKMETVKDEDDNDKVVWQYADTSEARIELEDYCCNDDCRQGRDCPRRKDEL